MASVDLRALKVDDFEARQNEAFTVTIPQAEISLKLTKVQRLGDSGRPGGAFSLWFMSPPGPHLPQRHLRGESSGDGQARDFPGSARSARRRKHV